MAIAGSRSLVRAVRVRHVPIAVGSRLRPSLFLAETVQTHDVTYLVEVHGPHGGFFLRAEPWNYRVDSLAMFAPLERLLKRDQSWVIQVRAYHEDPFGPIVHLERVTSKDAVPSAIKRIEQEIHQGTIPTPTSSSGDDR